MQVQPDVAGHVNGGPTALPLDHVERILDETSARVEIVHNGNVKAAGEVAALVGRREELPRLVIGTDSPAGSGAQPLGMLRAVSWVASLGGIDAALAVAAATGNVTSLHGLHTGVLEVGREADLLVMDAPLGSQADDALGALDDRGHARGRVGDHRRHAAVHEEPQYAPARAPGVLLDRARLAAPAGYAGDQDATTPSATRTGAIFGVAGWIQTPDSPDSACSPA